MKVGDKRLNKIDTIFMLCVYFLQWLAKRLGMTYNEVNVWIFCVIWPIITLVSIGLNVYLLIKFIHKDVAIIPAYESEKSSLLLSELIGMNFGKDREEN